jgi:hypothetical protein
MIPQLVTVRHRRRDGRRLRLFLPVLPVLLLLAPLLVLAVPAGVVACLITGVSPVGALRGAGRLLCALPGTRIDIEDGRTAIHVNIR